MTVHELGSYDASRGAGSLAATMLRRAPSTCGSERNALSDRTPRSTMIVSEEENGWQRE
jgi:hypothetical protein